MPTTRGSWTAILTTTLLLGIIGCAPQPSAPAAGPPPTSAPPKAEAPKAPAPAKEAAKPAPAAKEATKPATQASPAGKAPPVVKGGPVKVRVGMSTSSFSYAPIHLAAGRGFFKEVGIDPDIAVLAGGPAFAAAFLGDEIDIGAGAGTNSIEFTGQGRPVKTFYVINHQQTMRVIASKDYVAQKGIDLKADWKQKMAKLKGSTFGVSSLGGAEHVTILWLAGKGGLKEDDFSVVRVGLGAHPAALQTKQIDAFSNSPPAATEPVVRGTGVVLVEPSEVPEFKNYVHTVALVKDSYAEKNPELIRAFAWALDRAKTAIRENPEAAARDLKKSYGNLDEQVLIESVKWTVDALGNDGRSKPEEWKNALAVIHETSKEGLRGKNDPNEGVYWTNKYLQ